MFAALVAASPVIFNVAGRHSPEFVGHLVVVAWIYYAGCAIALRSPIILGVIAAPFVLFMLSLAGPAVSCTRYYVPNESDVIGSAVVIPILGAVGGWVCHRLYVSRKLPTAVGIKNASRVRGS
jgi:hypothetical protein